MSISKEDRRMSYAVERLKGLQEKLGRVLDDYTEKSYEEVTAEIRAAEKEVDILRVEEALEISNRVNGQRRVALKNILALPIIDPDWITNDGYLNKTKKKVCPELFAFAEMHEHVYFEINYSDFISVHLSGYEYRQIDHNREPWGDFDSACEGNSIRAKDKTLKTALREISKIKALTEKIKIEKDKYDAAIDKLDKRFYEDIHLCKRDSYGHYTYSTHLTI